MAVMTTKDSTFLRLKVKVGVDSTGKDELKNINLSKIKVTAEDETVFNLAKAFENVLAYPVIMISKVDEAFIAEV